MTVAGGSVQQLHPSLKQSFEDYFRNVNSSAIFKKWSMLMAVACSLERRIWTQTEQGPIFPNLFVFLLGPPASGKTAVLNPLRRFLHATGVVKVAPDTMTAASLLDIMVENTQTRTVKGHPLVHCSLTVASSEFGSLIPSYDQSMLTRMSELFDAGVDYISSTRGGGIVKLEMPCLNLIAGTQPKFMNSLLPESAWQQGFMARVITVYSNEVHLPTYEQLFEFTDTSPKQEIAAAAIRSHLKRLAQWYGPVSWSREAGLKLVKWIESDQEPKPKHPKLEYYCARRWFQLIKLSMIYAAMDEQQRVEECHVEDAMAALFEAEGEMGDGFAHMAQSPDSETMRQAYAWVLTQSLLGEVSENELRGFLSTLVTVERIDLLIVHMKAVGILDTGFGLKGALVKPGTLGANL